MIKFSLEPDIFWTLAIIVGIFFICLVFGVCQIINNDWRLYRENQELKGKKKKEIKATNFFLEFARSPMEKSEAKQSRQEEIGSAKRAS